MLSAITRLTVSDFRNYGRAVLDPRPGPVVLTGENGAGKTNLLEAISYLAPGRGLRGAKLGEVTRMGAARWAVAATVETPRGEVRVGTGIEPREGDGEAGASDRRVVHVDGASATAPTLAEILRISWLTPQMDRLFIEGASGRRRFFDRLVMALHPAHGRETAGYERAMRERNRVLAMDRPDAAWLAALEQRMAEHGVAVAAARLESLARLKAAIEMSGGVFPRADLALEGTLEADLAAVPAIEAEDRFRHRLAAGRARDAAMGRAGDGPHLADLRVTHCGKNMPAELCSTGEQKALLIGITLAAARLTRAETGVPPVMLLDEVAAHLDARRRAALFEELLALGAQAFMTGTDRALFAPLDGQAQFYSIFSGTVTPED